MGSDQHLSFKYILKIAVVTKLFNSNSQCVLGWYKYINGLSHKCPLGNTYYKLILHFTNF